MAIEISSGLITPDLTPLEVVERKGLGHPDTLVDGIVEAADIEYSRYCRENFGAIPHHNLDKAMLLGGLCIQKLGGGVFEAPLTMLFMGRASRSFGDQEIPLEDIQDRSARNYLSRVMPHLDTSDPAVYQFSSLTSTHSTRPHWFSPRSTADLPELIQPHPTANDTATMISYWPLTESERLSLDLEGYFYTDGEDGLPKPRFDYIGQDIKVMVVRHEDAITATLAVPQIATNTPDLATYFEREAELEQKLQSYADELSEGKNRIKVILNTQTKGNNPRPYLVTGGSCTDFGEEGAVGRGNKTHGIIASFRPNTMEAPHGKNPTYFVGKLLGYHADKIAVMVADELNTRCQVVFQANLGDNLFDPSRVIVSTTEKVDSKAVEAIVDESLALGRETTNRIIDEKHFLPRTHSWRALNARE